MEQKRIEAWIAIYPEETTQIISTNREYEIANPVTDTESGYWWIHNPLGDS